MLGKVQRVLALASTAKAMPQSGQNNQDVSLKVSVSSNVTAGVSTRVTIDSASIPTDFDLNNSSALRVRLYNSVANYAVCTLIDATPQRPAEFDVTVPIDVGPPGGYYGLAVNYVETDFLDDVIGRTNTTENRQRFDAVLNDQFSNVFFLANATSAWSSYEKQGARPEGHQLGALFLYGNASIPCTSYECVRKCSQLYPTPKLDDSQSPTATYSAAYLKCAGECEGVKLPSDPKSTGDPNAPPNNLLTPPPINTTCDAAQFRTPCGDLCCSSGQVCLPWGSCVAADNQGDAAASALPTITPTPTGLIPTPTSTAATNVPTTGPATGPAAATTSNGPIPTAAASTVQLHGFISTSRILAVTTAVTFASLFVFW